MDDDHSKKQSLKSTIESTVSKFTDIGQNEEKTIDSSPPGEYSKLSLLSSFFNGMGVGLLLGLLLGLAVSPVELNPAFAGFSSTRSITNKGFRGMRRVVARFNFSCTLIGQSPAIPYCPYRHRWQNFKSAHKIGKELLKQA